MSARRRFVRALLDSPTGRATVEAARAGEPALPPGINPVMFGPLANPFRKAGIITKAESLPTTRAVAHARPVNVWQLVDRAEAEHWLATNPEPYPVEVGNPADVRANLDDLRRRAEQRTGRPVVAFTTRAKKAAGPTLFDEVSE